MILKREKKARVEKKNKCRNEEEVQKKRISAEKKNKCRKEE